jgi:transcriptional regulator of arginine metabolism
MRMMGLLCAHDLVREVPMPNEIDHRNARRETILAILRAHRVTNQGDLAARLRERGFTVTQSSVSRDLRDLGAVKVDGRYETPDPGDPGNGAALGTVAGFIREARAAGPHLTVVSTAVGTAQSVALAIDHAGWPEVAGTVAGDDTLFVATASGSDQRRLMEHLRAATREKVKTR